MSDETPKEIHARVEIVAVDDNKFITAEMEAVTDEDNRAVVFARWLGRNLYHLQEIAWKEHQARKELVAERKSPIKLREPRIAGPDGKPIN